MFKNDWHRIEWCAKNTTWVVFSKPLERRTLKFIWNCLNVTDSTINAILNIALNSRKSVVVSLDVNFRYLAERFLLN